MGRILADRSKFIGGSDAGAIAGLSPWRSAYHVYLEKRGELPTDLEFDDENENAEWGTRLEGPVAQGYAERTGRMVRKSGGSKRHPKYPFLVANVDRDQFGNPLQPGPGVLEVKCCNWRQRKRWVESGVPPSYYLQLQHYLMVKGFDWGSFAVLFGGCELISFDIARDTDVITKLLALELDFWDRVQTGRPPDPIYDVLGLELVNALYPQAEADKEIVIDTPEMQAKVRRLVTLKEAIKERQKAVDELEAWVKWQMGTAERLLVPGIARLSWKTGQMTRLNAKKLKETDPKTWMQYAEETGVRRFLVKPIEDIAAEEIEEGPTQIGITAGVRKIVLE